MATGIACKTCGATFGAMEAPDAETLKAMLGKFHMSALASMVPPDASLALANALVFECGACILRRARNDDGQQAQLQLREEVAGKEVGGKATAHEARGGFRIPRRNIPRD